MPAVAAPSAAAAAPTPFIVCAHTESCGAGYTYGDITWHNRTATVDGFVRDDQGPGSTTAVFEAFAGATKIDSTTRTANADSSLGSPREYYFTIGDTDLVGGIDRIKITVCRNLAAGVDCGLPVNYSR